VTTALHQEPAVGPVEDLSDYTLIQPRRSGLSVRSRELWAYRTLLRFFGHRILEKSYIRSKLGIAWVPLRPILDVSARALIFGALLKAPSNGVPYLLFFLVGMAPWSFFDRSLFWSTRSIDINSRLVKKLYFPRIVLPLAAYLPAIFDFVVYVALIAVAIAGYAIFKDDFALNVSPELLLVVPSMLLIFALSLGLSLVLSVLGAQTRDVRYSLTYVLQFVFVLTPIIYPLNAIPDKYQWLANLNPVSAPIEMFRQGVLGAGTIRPGGVLISVGAAIVVLFAGLWFFSRAEAASIDSL
jgi:homopolymeric O-antigen transport system permease protein